MYFDSLAAALQMDGHGIYVWPVYALGVLIISALVALPRRRERQLLRRLAGDIRRQGGARASEEE